MKSVRLVAVFTLMILLSACAHRGVGSPKTATEAGKAPSLDTPLPIDPATTVGKLDNGLTYFIRQNGKPEKRMELRLVVNAGSILEGENQRGVAHFDEHMAFGGTEHFEKHELTNYLESIGMRFGPDLNAYTSFDETVYMLQVPSDSTQIVEKAFQILEDWSHLVSYKEDAIDRERGVVKEEWRLGRGAEMRMLYKQLPVILKDSRYADRLPIGLPEIIEKAPYDAFRAFYHDWYRPDLMAIVAVGDFDPKRIETLIREHFSRIPPAKDAPPRTLYPVPDHPGTLFAIATDPEANRTGVSVYYNREKTKTETVRDYRTMIVHALYNSMFNQRLAELTLKADPPFLSAYSDLGDLVRTKGVYELNAAVREDGIERGLDALLTEAERVRRFGFTPSELERQKSELLRGMEQTYAERDKIESGQLVGDYVDHYLANEPIPGIEYKYILFKQYLPGITLDEVNRLSGEFISENNRTILVNAPEKTGVKVPSQDDLQRVFDAAGKKQITAYVDTVSSRSLVGKKPKSSRVVKERIIKEVGVTEWTLANGLRVVLKPTDFKNDELLFGAYSPGGTSLTPDSGYIPAMFAPTIVEESGAGEFTQTDLIKKLSGKIVEVSPWINDLQEGFSGSASTRDMETMFQLIYLYFTAPRADSTAYRSVMARMQGAIENRSARPETAFSDTIQVTMTQHNYRALPWTPDRLKAMDMDKSFRIYRERFSNAGDFTFFFVGSFDPSKIRPLVETWLGGLPSSRGKETWRDTGIRPPRGVIQKEVYRGMEPKSLTQIIFTAPFEWNLRNRYVFDSMASLLRIRLREVLREDKSGTYGVSVNASLDHYPEQRTRLSIGFGSSPDRVDELTKSVFVQLDSLINYGATDAYLAKVTETQLRQREVSLKENDFWLNILQSYYFNGDNPVDILKYTDLVHSLTINDLREAARKYLDMKNYVDVVLYPKKGPEEPQKK